MTVFDGSYKFPLKACTHPSPRRWRGDRLLVAAGGVFQQGLVEVIGGALGVAEVVGGDGEDVFAKLHFQHDAGGGEGGAELSEIAFGFDLAFL